MTKKSNWDRFEQGQLVARVDGGPAGVYYCEDLQSYQEAVTKIILGTGSGLWVTEYYTKDGDKVG